MRDTNRLHIYAKEAQTDKEAHHLLENHIISSLYHSVRESKEKDKG